MMLKVFHYANTPLKGSSLIYQLARKCARDNLPYRFTVSISNHDNRTKKRFSKLENVNVLGECRDIFAEISKHDVVLLPNFIGSFGVAVPYTMLEAMVVGKPVIASGVGSHAEIIKHCESGYILRKPSVKHILKALEFLRNPVNRNRIGGNAKESVQEKFNSDAEYDGVLGVYRDEDLKLNLGCGHDYMEGWTNVDIRKDVKTDVTLNLNDSFPWRNKASKIKCRMVVQYLKDGYAFLDQCHIALRKGGELMFTFPYYTSPHAQGAFSHTRHFAFNAFESQMEGKFQTISRRYIFSTFRKCRVIEWFLNLAPRFFERIGLTHILIPEGVVVEALKE